VVRLTVICLSFIKSGLITSGSSSVQALIEEDSHVHYRGNIDRHPLLSRVSHDPNIEKLLSAPMLVCTVDHMVPATESLSAGRQIAPMLRLMSSDLILDELDDYDLNDLPALTRLVYWAGVLGTRVVLSSATLPPSLVEGMYLAWRAGRMQYRRNRGSPDRERDEKIQIPCLWVDEFGAHHSVCSDAASFAFEHEKFIQKRSEALGRIKPLRRAEIVPLEIRKEDRARFLHRRFAEHLRLFCFRLHNEHAETDPISNRHVSFGIIRMANISPLFDVAREIFALGGAPHIRIHLCVYHAQIPILQRSAMENLLDTVLSRKGDPAGVYWNPAVRTAIDACPEENHLFLVLASPVCEVGRDWDADWAVAEPSSMRAVIQLGGRLQRHRGKCCISANLLVLNRNFRSFQERKLKNGMPAPVFVYPGFEYHDESLRFRLRSPFMDKLVTLDEYQILTALPRIRPRPMSEWRSRERLGDLEQARTAASMLPRDQLPDAFRPANDAPMGRDEATWSWGYLQSLLTGVLPQQQPFREETQSEVTLVFLPNGDANRLILNRIAKKSEKNNKTPYVSVDRDQRHKIRLEFGEHISPWGQFDLLELLSEQSKYLGLSLCDCAKRLATVQVKDTPNGWQYHQILGFSRGKPY